MAVGLAWALGFGGGFFGLAAEAAFLVVSAGFFLAVAAVALGAFGPAGVFFADFFLAPLAPPAPAAFDVFPPAAAFFLPPPAGAFFFVADLAMAAWLLENEK